jgi:xylan 1,4-beta-xylosidase
MTACRKELGFKYVRFHGLLNDDMSVCVGIEKFHGRTTPVCSFFNVDSVFDFLVSIGMKPFIELSFMPELLASGSQTCFHYKANVTPPKDYRLWELLIEQLARHLVSRYGLKQVATWPFEVWNEPNLDYFWSGDQNAYFRLYDGAARAIKKVNSRLLVGGPATARNEWITEMIEHCRRARTPLDFLSTHHYPTDVALGNYADIEARMAKSPRGILGEMARTARAAAGDRTLYYTEWNNSPSSRDHYHDMPYAAAFVIKTIADVAPWVDGYSYWTFTDIFEESPFPSEPFHGGFGLLSLFDVPKPTYRAFQFLNRTGNKRLAVHGTPHGNLEVLATRKSGAVVILVTNHNVPLSDIRNEKVEIRLAHGRVSGPATMERIDEENANPRAKWIAMGRPVYPDRRQVKAMLKASETKARKVTFKRTAHKWAVQFSIPPQGTVCLTVPLY